MAFLVSGLGEGTIVGIVAGVLVICVGAVIGVMAVIAVYKLKHKVNCFMHLN